jgi:thioredoxin-related protein
MPRTRLALTTLLVIVSLLSMTRSASAQDVRWRHDYTAARREANETGRPLFFDFGTESCFWCKKLDATTFRDPKVAKMLNDQFIPVKLDGEKEMRLVQAMGIDGYPTVIVATPEGKVVGRHSGYLDAAQMTALLNKAPAPAAPNPVKPVMVKVNNTSADRPWTKEQIDAELAVLHRKIAASLER